MSHIVDESEFLASLGNPEPSDLTTAALDSAEAMFEAECGRVFFGPKNARVEVHDGTGSYLLYLEFPVNALTSVKLGYNPSLPDETLPVNDKSLLNWAVGSDRLMRLDGRFGWFRQPNYVQVTYDSQSNITDSARAAVKAAGKLIYNGALGGTGERVGAYSVDQAGGILKTALETNDVWQIGVAANRSYRAIVA